MNTIITYTLAYATTYILIGGSFALLASKADDITTQQLPYAVALWPLYLLMAVMLFSVMDAVDTEEP